MGTLILIALIAAAGYLISLRVHPYRKCRACGSGGRHSTKRNFGNCWRCRNQKRARLGVQLLMRRTYDDIQAGKHGRFH